MIFEKLNKNEEGYLLLESLVTLGIIFSIILMIIPLLVHWMMLRNEAKEQVEMNRLFYEYAFEWDAFSTKEHSNSEYLVEFSKDKLSISMKENSIEVEIYGYEFE